MRIRSSLRYLVMLAVMALTAGLLVACGGDDDDDGDAVATGSPAASQTPVTGGSITVYSGRAESLVGPLFKRFTDETGIEVKARYGETAELAATILEEGGRSPADVYFAQDAGGLGALQERGRLDRLSDAVLNVVDTKFRSRDGRWVGVSGRARVVAYNSDKLKESDMPRTIMEFTNAKWRGKIGWVPTNGSFQSFVTALRVQSSDDAARRWLREIDAIGAKDYPNNAAALQAVVSGEVEVAFINHYYLYQLTKQRGSVPARNYFFPGGDPGSMVNVAGVGILTSSGNKERAQRFVDYLLSPAAQQYFATETYEYPLRRDSTFQLPADLPALNRIEAPNIDLSRLSDLEGTLKMLRETGVLP